MALTLAADSSRICKIEEFVSFVESSVRLDDLDSLASAAVRLRELANDRTLVIEKLNSLVDNAFQTGILTSAQSLLLGQGKDFYVRANVWPSTSDLASGKVYQDQFSYNIPHDHNFSFLTVGYSGPGYETDIYEYDFDKVEGYIGEPVDIRFLEKVKFSTGMVMLYRAHRDLHIQYPPEQMTVTLNLIAALPEARLRDQFTFDLNRKVISGMPEELESRKRAAFVAMAGHMGGQRVKPALEALAADHPCRRTRLAAYEGLCRLQPEALGPIWERAAADADALIVNHARRQLQKLGEQQPSR